ncbi:hypothetical protein JAMGFMIE_03031 [Rheinheimera sp. MM224]|nr:hypothetical protein JAMGFMIE_03031 [Rheinheimera sp. MM224]
MTPQVKPGKEIPVHLTMRVLLLKRVNASDEAGHAHRLSAFIRDLSGLIFGGSQGVMKLDKGYVAGSDSRRDGVAAAH